MPDQAPNIDIEPGSGGRLVYDKARRTIVAERKAMSPCEWRAVKNVAYPKYWGIETTDPAALEAGDEMLVAPEYLSEIAAKAIVEAHNSVVRQVTTQIELLSNPVAVHINMVRGVIAKPSWENLRHLYPRIYELEHEARRGTSVSNGPRGSAPHERR